MAQLSGQDRAEAVARLSHGQLACLRLVMDGRTSKEIAKELGISPHTVDQRLRLAIQALGVESRFEAARLVRQVEGGAYQRPVYQAPQEPAYQPPHVAAADLPVLPPSLSGDTDGVSGRDMQSVVGEARPSFEPLPIDYSPPFPPPATQGGEGRNDLAPIVRVAWTVGLMIGVVLALGLLVTAAEGLVRLLDAIRT